MDLFRFLLHVVGQLPAGVRHTILVCLTAALSAFSTALSSGKAPGDALFIAWLAVLAVVTPLIQSYGVKGDPDDSGQ